MLRKLGDEAAAAALLEALERELADQKTWETQYQLIMAVAACRSKGGQPLLERILTMSLEPMVHLAAGDALVRLSEDVDGAIMAALKSASPSRAEGALRALAMMHSVPAPETIDAIITFAWETAHRQLRFWVCAAASGWRGPRIRSFLEDCLSDAAAETQRAAKAALEGRYIKWHPL